MILHKAGYVLTIKSWENDGDHSSKTETHYSDVEKMKDAIAFCKLFSKSYRTAGFVGNVYDPNDAELEIITDIFNEFYLQHNDFLEESVTDKSVICDWCLEVAYDIGLSGSDFFTRMCSGIEVRYFKEDVHCDDVTEDFV